MIGETLNGVYRVSELVGGGGFADVYLGRDLRSNTVVALKLLHPHYSRDPTVVQRFFGEARAAQSLTEPHVVRVLDAGQDRGRCYLVMEYVQGLTLDELLRRRGPLPPREAVGYALQVLGALEAAHAVGIVHRDIKPQNLMVVGGGFVKVMDFGVARMPSARGLTQSGQFLGTPAYMAPEQASAAEIDGRADLYSLATTLFELLVGRPPFVSDNPWETLLTKQTIAAPPLRQLRPDAPPALEHCLARGLEKAPTRRFQSAAEMRRALEQALHATGEGQHPITSPPRKPSVPHARRVPPALIPLGMVGMVMALAGVALALTATAPVRMAFPSATLAPTVPGSAVGSPPPPTVDIRAAITSPNAVSGSATIDTGAAVQKPVDPSALPGWSELATPEVRQVGYVADACVRLEPKLPEGGACPEERLANASDPITVEYTGPGEFLNSSNIWGYGMVNVVKRGTTIEGYFDVCDVTPPLEPACGSVGEATVETSSAVQTLIDPSSLDGWSRLATPEIVVADPSSGACARLKPTMEEGEFCPSGRAVSARDQVTVTYVGSGDRLYGSGTWGYGTADVAERGTTIEGYFRACAVTPPLDPTCSSGGKATPEPTSSSSHAWLGIDVGDVDGAVVITAVDHNAHLNGKLVRVGDHIVRIGTHQIMSLSDFRVAVDALTPGQPTMLFITHSKDGSVIGVTITPTAPNAEPGPPPDLGT